MTTPTYECHITVQVKDALQAELLATDATRNGDRWKTSEIKRDPVLGDASHFYLTAHSTTFMDIMQRMHVMSGALQTHSVKVLREKIELIVHDQRFQ